MDWWIIEIGSTFRPGTPFTFRKETDRGDPFPLASPLQKLFPRESPHREIVLFFTPISMERIEVSNLPPLCLQPGSSNGSRFVHWLQSPAFQRYPFTRRGPLIKSRLKVDRSSGRRSWNSISVSFQSSCSELGGRRRQGASFSGRAVYREPRLRRTPSSLFSSS